MINTSFLNRFKSKFDFYRSEMVKGENGYLPTKFESTAELNKLTTGTPDLNSYASEYADKLLWGVSLRENVTRGLDGHYSTRVAVGRFLARYALDDEFRKQFLENPSSFAIANVKSRIPVKDLYVFEEIGDIKLYPLKGNTSRLEKGHLIAQKVPKEGQDVELVHPQELFRVMRILESTHPDFGYRTIGNMLFTAGFDRTELQKIENSIVIINRDEGQYRRTIDAVRIAFNKAKEGTQKLSEGQLIDIASRAFTKYLGSSRFDPKMVKPEDYVNEFKKVEGSLPKIEPDLETEKKWKEGNLNREINGSMGEKRI